METEGCPVIARGRYSAWVPKLLLGKSSSAGDLSLTECPLGHWLKLPWQAGKTGAAQIAA